MSDDRFDLTMLLMVVVVVYAVLVEWTATHWFGQSRGMGGGAIVVLPAVWVWLAHRRVGRANGGAAIPPQSMSGAFARTAAPALAIATLLLLPQLAMHRWWEAILLIAGAGLALRLWHRGRSDAARPDPRPNDQ